MSDRFFNNSDYKSVAASQTDAAVGAKGCLVERIVIIPSSTSPGAVSIKDGADSAITIFAGGSSSIATLTPIVIELGIKAKTGALTITTGANLSVLIVGRINNV